MQVEATFTDLTAGAARAAHEPFVARPLRAARLREERVRRARGAARTAASWRSTRPDPSGWTVAAHGGAVTVRYKVYGDRIDGTYLAIDTTHVHMNMPAAIMWARGLDDRAGDADVRAAGGRAGRAWTVATQLHPGATRSQFTAPNLQYLMDSPVEFGPLAMRQFSVGGRTFRVRRRTTRARDGELDGFVQDVERIVREEGAIFGEYPDYEPGYYTFLADYLPYADGDGMEHRNSTVMTSSATHSRRPRAACSARWRTSSSTAGTSSASARATSSRSISIARTCRASCGSPKASRSTTARWCCSARASSTWPTRGTRSRDLVDIVVAGPGAIGAVGRRDEPHGAVHRRRPGRSIGPTGRNTVISYYPFGGAIALALDLTLRDRSDGRITLDDFMRAMWRVHGKPGGSREGYVDRPYTIGGRARRGSRKSAAIAAFARDFFDRYIRGREVADYARAAARAGFAVKKRDARPRVVGRRAHRCARRRRPRRRRVPANSPAYAAGLDQDDTVTQIGGERITSPKRPTRRSAATGRANA